jgi:hypothetical protein
MWAVANTHTSPRNDDRQADPVAEPESIADVRSRVLGG